MKFRIGKADTQTISGYLFVGEYSCPICPEKFKLFAPKDADQSAIESAKEGALFDLESAIDKLVNTQNWTGDVSKAGPFGTTCMDRK